MQFIPRDNECLAELRDMGVLTPSTLEQINARLGRPERCDLIEFLLGGADLISEGLWLTWLIRRHECHRFGRVKWKETMIALEKGGPLGDGNLPYQRCADGSLLVAVMRPDLLSSAISFWKTPALHLAATTLPEMHELRRAWRTHAE